MKPGKQATRDGLEILHRRYVAGRPEAEAMLEEAEESAQIASRIHELRTRASLTQRELAERIGTSPAVICRLENDDYGDHSLSMLRRIARVLGHRLEVRFVRATS